jgi:DNA alkylation repair enzyme
LNHAGVVEEIERLLRAAGTPERAAQERRYLKSDLEFVGAGLPAVRAVARDVLKANANADRGLADRARPRPLVAFRTRIAPDGDHPLVLRRPFARGTRH